MANILNYVFPEPLWKCLGEPLWEEEEEEDGREEKEATDEEEEEAPYEHFGALSGPLRASCWPLGGLLSAS